MLEHAALLAALHYDPATGIWTRLQSFTGRVKVGDRADQKRPADEYRRVRIFGQEYLSHRLAWFYMTGKWPDKNIDHKDTNPGNNSWFNLRQATQQENTWNARRPKTNKSGFKGVYWNKEKSCWSAQIKMAKSTHLGHFATPEEAHEAYKQAAIKLRKEFARHD